MMLRTARKAEGLSLPVLANQTGVSFSQLGAIERGEKNPSLNLLWNLCRRLEGLSSHDFVVAAATLDSDGEAYLDLRALPEELRSTVIMLMVEAL